MPSELGNLDNLLYLLLSGNSLAGCIPQALSDVTMDAHGLPFCASAAATNTTSPTATQTSLPTSDTPVPTDSPSPTDTPVTADAKAVTDVRLTSNQPGVLEVSWDAPSQTPRDYRVNWAKVGENFPLIGDNIGKAFPTSPAYTISGLDKGVQYKVKIRACGSGERNGDWTEEYQADIASS